MPIYKQKNNEDAVVESLEINYHDTENRLATEAICVHFGYGDVVINQGASRNDYADELCFRTALSTKEIGYKQDGESYDKRPIFPPVRFVFDRPESIDVVIAELQELKSNYPAKAAIDVEGEK